MLSGYGQPAMRDGWKKFLVGEVVQQVRRRTQISADKQYPLLGVRWYGAGPFHRETVTDKTSKATQLFRVHEGDFIYNRLFAWKGSFGIIPPDFDGFFVSGEFPVFETDKSLLSPQYLNLLMCRPEVWVQVDRESTGSTTTSRNRWKEERFLQYQLALPAIEAQRRMVDLIAAVDADVRASEVAPLKARGALSAAIDGATADSECKLGDRVTMSSGPSWNAAQVVTALNVGALPVIGITNTRPNGRLDISDRRHVIGLSAATPLLRPSSLVMIRTNGNRMRIGNVYRVPPEAVGCAFSAFQIGMQPHEPSDVDFLYWYLRSPRAQKMISEAAS
ncbi:MAG: restriction endonuclease subunit S, partial [Actinobacteria bacterium]|nr:restriction endonuclease subunit S [Actinomycetota bacterium]